MQPVQCLQVIFPRQPRHAERAFQLNTQSTRVGLSVRLA